MKDQKSHARIHKVILQLRQNSQKNQNWQKLSEKSNNCNKLYTSCTTTMESSQILSQSQSCSQSLNMRNQFRLYEKNGLNISNSVSAQYLNEQKEKSVQGRREIKTARHFSRRKVSSKDKYSKTQQENFETRKIEQTKSSNIKQLQILQSKYFIEEIRREKEKQIDSNQVIQNIKAFWIKQNIFVSLFPIQYSQCIAYSHSNIIPIYGQVQFHQKRYIVSNQYKNSSLKQLIEQFGPFQQNLCKNYLVQIIKGLQQMHKHKVAHNRLTIQNILYNKQGQIFLNVVKSTSRPLSQKQKQQRLYQYSPEILLQKNKSNSISCDIWSLGIMFLEMLFAQRILQKISLHPYNTRKQYLKQNDQIIVDNIKQLYIKKEKQKSNVQKVKNKQINKKEYQNYGETQQKNDKRFDIQRLQNDLSQECKDLIKKCLCLNKEDRITLKQIREHIFLKEVSDIDQKAQQRIE